MGCTPLKCSSYDSLDEEFAKMKNKNSNFSTQAGTNEDTEDGY